MCKRIDLCSIHKQMKEKINDDGEEQTKEKANASALLLVNKVTQVGEN